MTLVELEAMSTEEIKLHFEDIMQKIVFDYGDNTIAIDEIELEQEKGGFAK